MIQMHEKSGLGCWCTLKFDQGERKNLYAKASQSTEAIEIAHRWPFYFFVIHNRRSDWSVPSQTV